MKFSYFGIGVIATTTYSIWAVVHGSILMSRQGDYKNAANNVLNDAKSRFDAANSLYLASEAALTDAQNTISNAECYVKQYPGFTVQLARFCEDSSNPANPISVLDQKYAIQIVHKPSEQLYSTREDYDIVYYYTTENQCTTNSDGKKTCKDVSVRKSRREYYTVNTVIKLNYGTVVTGTGSQLYMRCGQYDHGVAISTKIWQRSTTGMRLINKYNEEEIRTFTSAANVDIAVDNQLKAGSNEVATSNTNYPQIATKIVELIDQQCNALSNTLKSTSYYSTIANNTVATLPSLQAEIDRTKKIKDQEAAYLDAKQSLYNSADSDYRKELALWLPLIFIPGATFIAALCCFKETLENKHIDTQDCCAPSIKNAIPVALYSYPRFLRNSRTNVTQENIPTAVALDDVEEQASQRFATVTAPPEPLEKIQERYNGESDEMQYFDSKTGMENKSNRSLGKNTNYSMTLT